MCDGSEVAKGNFDSFLLSAVKQEGRLAPESWGLRLRELRAGGRADLEGRTGPLPGDMGAVQVRDCVFAMLQISPAE